MAPRIELVGKRFGRLVVLSETAERQAESIIWLCRCDCGVTKKINGACLRKCVTRSCGCLARETGKLNAKKDAALNKVWGAYKASAKARHHTFSLTKQQFEVLISLPCFYCGAEPEHESVSFAGNVLKYNGIDRKYPTEGYSKENCVPCCWPCNLMKRSTSFSEFLQRVYVIADRQRGRLE